MVETGYGCDMLKICQATKHGKTYPIISWKHLMEQYLFQVLSFLRVSIMVIFQQPDVLPFYSVPLSCSLSLFTPLCSTLASPIYPSCVNSRLFQLCIFTPPPCLPPISLTLTRSNSSLPLYVQHCWSCWIRALLLLRTHMHITHTHTHTHTHKEDPCSYHWDLI